MRFKDRMSSLYDYNYAIFIKAGATAERVVVSVS